MAEYRTVEASGWHVVPAMDELDMASAPELRDALLHGITGGHHHVVLDMTRVTFIDSSGFAVLVSALKRLRASGGDLRIAGADKTVRSAMRISGLDQIFGLYPDNASAVADQGAGLYMAKEAPVVSADNARTLLLPADPASPQRARDFVAEVLTAWGAASLREEARLLTSELVTNAVMHARTDATVTVVRDDVRHTVRVTVTDESEARPRQRPYSPLATTGRGLSLVARAAKDFGVDVRAGGKTVWFELPLSVAVSEDPTQPIPT